MIKSEGIGRNVAVKYAKLKDGERVSAFLRRIHPERTAVNVSADTRGRIPTKTVENWLCGRSAPSFQHTWLLLKAYGPEFVTACMGDETPGWISDAGIAARNARIDAKIAELEAMREETHA